ncbi:hypothetical protein [Hydrogenothermus marinus]|uniref:Uncharacterized protein n=1 Tax=Hydrogenothermus marinus TaxID=133270 RepID=A0A3M0BZR6_9AQUI|nr:hypothetical protein [Hydrogenothermus marinus]RMB00066.1 hypothetical protein CLV39_0035 [Hydrogenothermus marinus]
MFKQKETVFIYYTAPTGKRVLTNTKQIVSYEHEYENIYTIYIKQKGSAKFLARDLGGEVVGDDIVKVAVEVDPRSIDYLPKDKEGIEIEKKDKEEITA